MPSLLTACRIYRRQALTTRLHVALRALTCPFAALLPYFPTSGTLLDVGCGHGLLLNLLAMEESHCRLRLRGIDHDNDKIAVASQCSPAGIDFSCASLAEVESSCCDAVSLIDVLYTVPLRLWPELLADCQRILKPGGLVLLKEVVDRPRWKYWAILAQETLSVRLFRLTRGTPPHFQSPATYCQALAAVGLTVQREMPLPSGSWVSHHLFIAQKVA